MMTMRVLDRLVQRGQRVFLVQRGDDLALLVGLRRQVAIQARQRHVDRRVGQFEQVGEALHRMLETGHPGKQRLRHRL